MDNNPYPQGFLNGGTYAVRPPPNALSEFSRVQTGDYSAQLGHFAGAVVISAIKSGMNRLHGSLGEYFRNNALDARNYFASSVPAYHQNQFGGHFGDGG